MPEFAFTAKDQAGNFTEGRIQASDMIAATNHLRSMGQMPIGLQLVSEDPTPANAPRLPNAAPDPSAPLVPPTAPEPQTAPLRLLELSEPTQAPAPWQSQGMNAPRPLVPLTGEMEPIQRETRLEPWQRGGPIEPPAPLQQTQPTQALTPPAGTVYAPSLQQGRSASAGRALSIPYGEGGTPSKSLWRRFLETMIFPIYAGVVFKEIPPFFRQFATLINAGIPLYQALAALESNTKNAKLKEICREGQKQVLAGGTFSNVMAAYPWIFQPVQIELVRASEQGGMFDKVLLQIADYVEHELEIRRIIRRETFYPKAVIFVALMVLGGNMAIVRMVLGQISVLQYLMATIGSGLLVLLPILGLVAVCRLFLFNVPSIREFYDRVKLTIPVVGNVTRHFAMARFTRTFAALYKGGFTVPQALYMAGNASGNAVVERAAHRAIAHAERGGLASEALVTTGEFPPMVLDMLRTGETTGNLDVMLDKVGDYFEDEGKVKAHQAAIGFGVLVFLIVAILVGMQIIAFWTGFGTSRTTLPDG